jgi:hypothetical protein
MNALLPADLDRLAKLCGMFGSSFGGERAVAAALADKLVRDAGLTWQAVLTEPPATLPLSRPVGWRELAAACHARPHSLTPWERDFVAGLGRFPRLSAKQSATLRGIADRVLGRQAP